MREATGLLGFLVNPFPLAVALTFAAAATAQEPAAPAEGGTVSALVGATLVNPGTPPLREAVVITRGERIACAGLRVECAIPAGARVVDVRDAYIIPGLIDAHVHYSQTGWVDGRPDAFDVDAAGRPLRPGSIGVSYDRRRASHGYRRRDGLGGSRQARRPGSARRRPDE